MRLIISESDGNYSQFWERDEATGISSIFTHCLRQVSKINAQMGRMSQPSHFIYGITQQMQMTHCKSCRVTSL
jgi:hypothetical protein